jgi:hypothetical protein
MAVEHSGAEAAPNPADHAQSADPAQPAGQADEVPSNAPSDIDELKRKFREALDRKRGEHTSAEGARDTGKVHGSHGPAVSRRSLRRKSGG